MLIKISKNPTAVIIWQWLDCSVALLHQQSMLKWTTRSALHKLLWSIQLNNVSIEVHHPNQSGVLNYMGNCAQDPIAAIVLKAHSMCECCILVMISFRFCKPIFRFKTCKVKEFMRSNQCQTLFLYTLLGATPQHLKTKPDPACVIPLLSGIRLMGSNMLKYTRDTSLWEPLCSVPLAPVGHKVQLKKSCGHSYHTRQPPCKS